MTFRAYRDTYLEPAPFSFNIEFSPDDNVNNKTNTPVPFFMRNLLAERIDIAQFENMGGKNSKYLQRILC